MAQWVDLVVSGLIPYEGENVFKCKRDSTGAPVAQWFKCWPTDLAVASSRPALGEIFSTVNTQPFIINLSSS